MCIVKYLTTECDSYNNTFLAQTLYMSWCVQYHTIELLLQQYQTDCELLVKLVM